MKKMKKIKKMKKRAEPSDTGPSETHRGGAGGGERRPMGDKQLSAWDAQWGDLIPIPPPPGLHKAEKLPVRMLHPDQHVSLIIIIIIIIISIIIIIIIFFFTDRIENMCEYCATM
jgi:hypothetical protein